MLVNTQYFKESGNRFLKTGKYIDAPKGTKDFIDFWKEEKKRCLEGYKVGDLWIPPRMYFYLNYFPILRTPEKSEKERNKVSSTTTKILGLPAFWEVQLEWWQFKHIAWYGSQFKDGKHYVKRNDKSLLYESVYDRKELLLKKDYTGGNHILCAKTRGCGFSYMDAADGVYNYNFIPNSKSYYLAFLESYLSEKDGILIKIWDALEHLNQNTQGFWKKNRHKINNSKHKKASYLDGEGNEKGYKSEIIGIVTEHARKVRGARGMKITIEEAGSYPNFMEVLNAALPLVTDGSITTGQITAFGTGGESEEGIEGLQKVFENPSSFDFMEFNNIWYEGGALDTCGYFVPVYRADSSFIDDDGNPKEKEAIEAWEKKYEKVKTTGDAKDVDKLQAERPMTPDMVFSRVNQNIFPVSRAKKRLQYLKTNRAFQSTVDYGELIPKEKKVEFKVQNIIEARPIKQYPHKNNSSEDLRGCITLFERPYEEKGIVPEHLYFIVVDPYYLDGAEDRTSLWAAYVWQRKCNVKGSQDKIVASYIGRPEKLDTCYRNTELLSDYYNATVNSEIAGGGQDLFRYFKSKNKLHRLEYEIIIDTRENTVKRNQRYFQSMPTETKKQALSYFASYLQTPIGFNEDGDELWNIDIIPDEGLLEEIIKFHSKGNFDRISACSLAPYMRMAKIEIEVTETTFKSNFFSRELFTDYSQAENQQINFLQDDVM